MAESLDAPTVYRTAGSPTLGVPVLSLDYRGTPEAEAPSPTAPLRLVPPPWEARLAALEARVTRLEQPWWRRLWLALRTFWRS